MSPTVRLDDETYEALKDMAEPFVDTPNTVIRRLVGLDPNTATVEEGEDDAAAAPSAPKLAVDPESPAVRRLRNRKKAVKRTRVANGELLPESEYELPILQALVEAGGSAVSREIVDRVGEMLEDKLTGLDRADLQSGGVRWQSRLQFVRLKLIKSGWMDKDVPRGTWAITDLGRKHFDNETEND